MPTVLRVGQYRFFFYASDRDEPEHVPVERGNFEMEIPTAEDVKVTDDTLSVDLADGRSISVPLAWYPRLMHATPWERSNWRLVGKGQGIHWQGLDEDVSVEGLLAGRRSGESQSSFRKWLETRNKRA